MLVKAKVCVSKLHQVTCSYCNSMRDLACTLSPLSLTHSPTLSLPGSVGRLWPSGSLAGVDGAVGRGQGSCAGSRLSLQSASACPGSPTGSWHHAAGISPNYNYQLQLQMETSRRTSPCILHGLQPPPHSTPQKA